MPYEKKLVEKTINDLKQDYPHNFKNTIKSEYPKTAVKTLIKMLNSKYANDIKILFEEGELYIHKKWLSKKPYQAKYGFKVTDEQLRNFYENIGKWMRDMDSSHNEYNSTLYVDINKLMDWDKEKVPVKYTVVTYPGFIGADERKEVIRNPRHGTLVIAPDFGVGHEFLDGLTGRFKLNKGLYNEKLLYALRDVVETFGFKGNKLDEDCAAVACCEPEEIKDKDLGGLLIDLEKDSIAGIQLQSVKRDYRFKIRLEIFKHDMKIIPTSKGATVIGRHISNEYVLEGIADIIDLFELNMEEPMKFIELEHYHRRSPEWLKTFGRGTKKVFKAVGHGIAWPFSTPVKKYREYSERRHEEKIEAIRSLMEEASIPEDIHTRRGELGRSCVVMVDPECAIERHRKKQEKEESETSGTKT